MGAVVLAGACVTGGVIWANGPDERVQATVEPGVAVRDSQVRLVGYRSCEEVERDLKSAALSQVTEWGLGNPPMPRGQIAPAEAAPAEQRQRSVGDHSTTNNHEAAADEPDLVKNDGARIVTASGPMLHVVDTATRKLVSTLALPGDATGLLLDGDHALVTVPRSDAVDLSQGTGMTTTFVLVDLRGGARIAGRLTVDGNFLDARQVGSVARLVVRSQPRLDFPAERSPTRNREIVKQAPLANWLPRTTLDVDGHRSTGQVDCTDVSRPTEYTGTSLLTVYTVDLRAALGQGAPMSIAADGDTVYGTGTSLYVADDRRSRLVLPPADPATPAMPRPETPQPDMPRTGPVRQGPPDRPISTDIHQFDISGAGKPVYVASGSVPGNLVNQYALSEDRGNLRVATTTDQSSAVTVLARKDKQLTPIGSVGGLGKGEKIQSVRYLGDTAYVVTFRRTDPLYTVDLADPVHPRVTGELKITGYSAYLHPLTTGRLLGVGQEATERGNATGPQVSLFDVSTAPARRLAQHQLPGGGYSEVEFDAHAFLYWPDKNLVAVPLETSTSSVLLLRVDGDKLTEVATLRLPGDGRVNRTLVAGGALWTVSDAGVAAVDMDSAAQIAWVPFR
ncbi:beta-propeller domain-containing protein [Actinokineospora inagensis]|uniref:beta-propeller domain-containing protein n=1 Tax=Actinokineospora inagensis TaxID=103730 RepID=UPI0004142D83|nr:beta-propeller domain-containing protein [Actinokineospora inagensis]